MEISNQRKSGHKGIHRQTIRSDAAGVHGHTPDMPRWIDDRLPARDLSTSIAKAGLICEPRHGDGE